MPPQSLRGPCGKSLDASSTIEEAQASADPMQLAEGALRLSCTTMGLPYGAPQLRCDNRGAIALTQGEGSWRTKTLVAKMRAIQSHLKAGYITVSHKKKKTPKFEPTS